MGQIILRNAVVRRPGFLYYVDGHGNVCEAVLNRGRKRVKPIKEKQEVEIPNVDDQR